MRRYGWLAIGLLALALWAWQQRAPMVGVVMPQQQTASDASQLPPPARAPRDDAHASAGLPREALATLQRIDRGGPYAYRQDGGVFQNRERRLPQQPRGYYREYTVATPGSRDRGARRIVAGGDPPTEFFYSDDHYSSFRRIVAAGARP